MAQKVDYTQGSIVATMLKTAVAMFASTLAMSGYNIVDTFFVGQLPGDEGPLAAMGYTFPVVMLIGCIFHGFGTGCMTTMAHAMGSKNMKEASQLVTSGLLTLMVLSLLLALLGVQFSGYAFASMGAKGNTLTLVKQYMNIWFIGCFTGALGMEGNKILIAAGYPRVSSAMTILGMIINTVLDPFMIFGGSACVNYIMSHSWGWLHPVLHIVLLPFSCFAPRGIQGAALATVISQAVSGLVILYFLYRARLIQPLEGMAPHWARFRRIVMYAIPAILGMLLMPVSNYVVTWVTSQFGDVVVAGFSAANKLESVAFVLPMSFGIPLMPIIAQNYGAGLYSRVRFCYKFAVTVAFCFLTTVNILLFFFGHHLSPFFSNVPAVQVVINKYFLIVPFGFALLEITRFCGFVMVACGHPLMDTVFKFVRILGILMPMLLLTHCLHWENGVFYSRMITDVLGGLICVAGAVYLLKHLPEKDAQ